MCVCVCARGMFYPQVLADPLCVGVCVCVYEAQLANIIHLRDRADYLLQCVCVCVAEAEWEDIIPEHLRDKVEEEERQQQLLELHLPPRSRKTIKQVWSSVIYIYTMDKNIARWNKCIPWTGV